MAEMLSSLKFDEEAMRTLARPTDMSTATELANHLVERYHVPFRQAHAIVGELVRLRRSTGRPAGGGGVRTRCRESRGG